MKTDIRKNIMDYKNGKITIEELNNLLRPYGIVYEPDKNPAGNWTDKEIEEGFIPYEGEIPVIPDEPKDAMYRDINLANTKIFVKTKRGNVDVYRNEEGYAYKALAV